MILVTVIKIVMGCINSKSNGDQEVVLDRGRRALITQSVQNPQNIPMPPRRKQTVAAEVLSVHDGDTCNVVYINEGGGTFRTNVRLDGIDTPEISRAEKWEIKAGKFARDKLKKLIDGRVVQLYVRKHDMYGGRIVGKITVDNIDVSQYMLDMGFAHPYDGRTRKTPWTKAECLAMI